MDKYYHVEYSVSDDADIDDLLSDYNEVDEGGVYYIGEPTDRWNNEMARGKGGLSSNVVLVTTRPRRAASMPAPEHYTPYTSYVAPSLSGVRASRATSHALDETEALSHQSRRNDQRLLDDITSRLDTYHTSFFPQYSAQQADADKCVDMVQEIKGKCRFEYDSVKPGRDVAMKTGFRRVLYDKIRPRAGKEAKAQRRKDQLLYPWNYSFDNIFHRRHQPETPTRRKKEEKPEVEEEMGYFDDEEEQILTAYDEWKIKKKEKKEAASKLKEKEEEEERKKPKHDPYPIHDPFGLYRPKPERKHIDLDDIVLPRKEIENKSHGELLANLKIKSLAMPRGRSPTRDVEYEINQVSQPLPRSRSLYSIPDNVNVHDYEKAPLNDDTARRIKESRTELANYENMLNTTFNDSQAFKARQHARAVARPITRRSYLDDFDGSDYGDYDMSDADDYDLGRPYYRHGQPPRAPRRPVLRTQAPITRASSPPRLTYRSSSLPPTRRYTPSADLAVRNAKSILGRLERDMGSDDVDTDAYDYGYTPAVSYRPPMAPARATPSRHLYRSTQAVPSRRYYQSTTPRVHPAEIESKVDYYAEPDLSPPYTGNLRARFSETRNKMDTHRTMMDKYLPIDMGPGNEVAYEVETKYGELANRMPQLEPYRPNKRACSLPPPGRRASVCSTRGLSEYASQPLRTPTFRPTMSDTRKRCRDVLCKTKGDARYFDY